MCIRDRSRNTGISEILIGTPLENFIVRPGNYQDILRIFKILERLSDSDFQALRSLTLDLSSQLSIQKFAIDFYNKFVELKR